MIHHWLKGKECIVKYIYSFKNTTIEYSSECVCLSVCALTNLHTNLWFFPNIRAFSFLNASIIVSYFKGK